MIYKQEKNKNILLFVVAICIYILLILNVKLTAENTQRFIDLAQLIKIQQFIFRTNNNELISKLNKITNKKIVTNETYPNFDKLIKANCVVLNFNNASIGSGTIIQYNSKIYILTASHLVDSTTDCVKIKTYIKKWYKVKIIKIDKNNDLMLLSIDFNNITIEEKKYFINNAIEISDVYPRLASKVYAIGNPAGIENIISMGIISKISSKYYYITAPIFYGNSGGALIYKGKLVGVVSSIQYAYPKLKKTPYFALGVVIKLELIKQFLDEYAEQFSSKINS